MLETVFEPVFFRFKTDQHARRLAVAGDDDLLRLCLSKEPRQIVLDFGQWNFLHSRSANCASHDSASDLATTAKTSTVVPETSYMFRTATTTTRFYTRTQPTSAT